MLMLMLGFCDVVCLGGYAVSTSHHAGLVLFLHGNGLFFKCQHAER